MKTVFDTNTREELIHRINTLNEHSVAQWGTMNVYQMIKHNIVGEEMMLGKKTFKRAFLGRIFGKIALKDMLNEKPIRHSTPTIPEMRVTGNGDVESEKKKWIALLEEHAHPSTIEIIHPFFGKITQEQIGRLVYKHTDHHLRQFNT